MDAAGYAAPVVVANVVLDDAEVGNAELRHLRALPVLLEPAARVTVDGQVENLQALNPGLGDGELLLKTNLRHDSPLLPLLRVPGLGGRLRGAPPVLVVAVPPDGRPQPPCGPS